MKKLTVTQVFYQYKVSNRVEFNLKNSRKLTGTILNYHYGLTPLIKDIKSWDIVEEKNREQFNKQTDSQLLTPIAQSDIKSINIIDRRSLLASSTEKL